MARVDINPHSIRLVKRRARELSRLESGRTYMQHLDAVARDLLGVRHFHEARQLATRVTPQEMSAAITSPLTWYLTACQESYFEI